MANNPPNLNSTAFDCPHCGAYTSQNWFRSYADSLNDDRRVPFIPDINVRERVEKAKDIPSEEKKDFFNWLGKIETRQVSFHEQKSSHYGNRLAVNLHLSLCYNCKGIGVWIHDRLVYPLPKDGVKPNSDLPSDIADDFNEAREIVNQSPRAAAALLRLAVQKLCGVLGEKGKNIDEDIGRLVSKGLNPLVQQALDVVRVIGNEAVHPGVIDLKDDRETAEKLFVLVNLIAEQMISIPKAVQKMYAGLPANKLASIANRDQSIKKLD